MYIDAIKKQYYFQLALNLIFLALTVIFMICIFEAPMFFDNLIISYILIAMFSLLILYLIYELVLCFMDNRSVRTNNFEEVTGIVIYYARNNNSETGRQINLYPIIKEINSNRTIKLRVKESTESDKVYTFIYLKHLKIGVIKETHSDIKS